MKATHAPNRLNTKTRAHTLSSIRCHAGVCFCDYFLLYGVLVYHALPMRVAVSEQTNNGTAFWMIHNRLLMCATNDTTDTTDTMSQCQPANDEYSSNRAAFTTAATKYAKVTLGASCPTTGQQQTPAIRTTAQWIGRVLDWVLCVRFVHMLINARTSECICAPNHDHV